MLNRLLSIFGLGARKGNRIDTPSRITEVGQYEWGMYRIQLLSNDTTKGEVNLTMLLVALTGIADWRTRGDFLHLIGLLHEIVHYHQDICTGVGHWDHIKRRESIKMAITEAQHSSHSEPLVKPGEYAWARAKQVSLASSSQFNAYHLKESAILPGLALECTSHKIDADTAHLFLLKNLFELQAVMQVYAHISVIQTSNIAAQIARENTEYFVPWKMAPSYRQSVPFFAAIFNHVFLDGDESEATANAILEKALCTVLPAMLESAFAFPPPSYFEKFPDAFVHFQPGVRMIRMVHRLTTMRKHDFEKFFSDIDSKLRYTRDFVYPSTTDIYNDWAIELKEISTKDAIAGLRSDLCNEMVTSRSSNKSHTPLNRCAPIYIDMPGTGFSRILDTNLRLHGDNDLFIDLDLSRMTNRMSNWFLTGRPFICPFSNGDCKVAIDACSSGITDLCGVPSNPSCRVQAFLNHHQFNINPDSSEKL